MGMSREETIRIFRKEIECLSHTTCEDCILEKACDSPYDSEYIEAYSMAIKALEQEPFINKPCVSSGVCEHDKQKVLDKIRAELIQSIQKGTLMIESGNEELFRIIDKYKAETEVEDGECK